jgi:Na+/H+ antiporter NhaD/arsenite permease-like protein
MNPVAYWQQMSWGVVFLNSLPFILLLLLIAGLPFIAFAAEWWEKTENKLLIAAVCAGGGVFLYLYPTGDLSRVFQTYLDYLAFLVLIGAFFTISGGIHISGAFTGRPYMNTLFLGFGGLLASILGTTGASLILIRPLLRANQFRRHKAHVVVFFIFIVCNCGGILMPLGNPPLFLGFLRGIPFFWTFHLIGEWSLTILILLLVFYLIDSKIFKKEEPHVKDSLIHAIPNSEQSVHMAGGINILYLLGILFFLFGSNCWLTPWLDAQWPSQSDSLSKMFQITAMLVLTFLSYKTTSSATYKKNHFSFGPMVEVGILFFGIFGAIIPLLAILEAKGPAITWTHPWQFFWASGILSGFLDNAPAYLSFAVLAAGQNGINPNHLEDLAIRFPKLLAAISCGTSFMGALTYIGNGPNFMVRAIAEQAQVKMPSFGGYLLWSGAVLIPVFILMTFVFF